MLLQKAQKFLWMSGAIIRVLYKNSISQRQSGELTGMKALNTLTQKKSTLQLPYRLF